VREWTKSACVAAALGIAFLLAVTGCGGPASPAQASTSIASSTQAAPASAPARLLSVTAAPVAAKPPVTWVVRPGDTLSGIAAALGVRGGWQGLYAANRAVIGPDPGLIRPGTTLAVPGPLAPLRYTVAPGDTLSGIAAALGVRGGWQALYAANRRAIGPDPGLIRPGTVLAAPGPAAAAAAPPAGTGPGAPASPGTLPGQPGTHGAGTHGAATGGTPAAGSTPGAHGTGSAGTTPAARGPATAPATAPAASPRGTASPAGLVPASPPQAAGIMPRWLKGTLLAVALLMVIAFTVPPALATGSRRSRERREQAAARDRGRRAAKKMARVVQADHERLIVTYSVRDDTVYLLTPPGEDPRAVLRAARLILPEDT
jgi:LysM repeat protein